MMTSTLKHIGGGDIEDPLLYLPRAMTTEVSRGAALGGQSLGNGLYLVLSGRVKITEPLEDGSECVLDFGCADDLIGEERMISGHTDRRIVALERTTIMYWPVAEVEARIESEPRLGVALVQLAARRSIDCQQRIEALAVQNTRERTGTALLGFARRWGAPSRDGYSRIPPFTHEELAQYTRSSRQMITAEMKKLREKGLVFYSRRSIEIDLHALEVYLSQERSHRGETRTQTAFR